MANVTMTNAVRRRVRSRWKPGCLVWAFARTRRTLPLCGSGV
jgi:hypothetical protein